MFDGGDAVAVGSYRQPLFPHVTVPHRGETSSVGGKDRRKMSSMNTLQQPVCLGFGYIALPASFEDGDVVLLSIPRLEVNTGLQAVLFEGLQDHTFGIDFCGGESGKQMYS